MTKVIVLGQEPKEEKKLKPIQVTKMICYNGKTTNTNKDISYYDEVSIIKVKNFSFDCIIIPTGINLIYLGHFNDGIV